MHLKIKNKKFNYYSYDNAKKNYNFDIFFHWELEQQESPQLLKET